MAWKHTRRNVNAQPICDYRPTEQMLSHCSDLVGDKNKHYFWLGRLFTGRGKAGDGLVRKPGPVWTCVITRCLSATSLGASTTQEKCYLSKTPDSSYLCNYKPRRKANNASVLLQNPSCKSRGCLDPSTQKCFRTRAFVFPTFEYTNQGKSLTGVPASQGNSDKVRAVQIIEIPEWLEIGIFFLSSKAK